MKKILITGGAGCLGSNVADSLINDGCQVLCIDNLTTGKEENIASNSKLLFEMGSICDLNFLERNIKAFAPDIIIHSAATYHDPSNWKLDIETNILGIVNIIKLSEKFNVKKIINFQTSHCYGSPKNFPVSVNYYGLPKSSYGISKTTAEQFLFMSKVPYVSLRLATIIAPRLYVGVIPSLYKKIQNGDECFCTDTLRDFIDISDFLKLINKLVFNEYNNYVFNVSNGEAHSILEIHQLINKWFNKNNSPKILPIKDDDIKEMVIDPSLTYKITGWKPEVKFDVSINKLLKWYDVNKIINIYSHLK